MRQADAVERARRIAEDARRPDLDGGRTPEAPAPPSPPRSLKAVPPPQRRAVRDAAFVRELGLLDVAALRPLEAGYSESVAQSKALDALLVEALGDAPAVSRADAARAAARAARKRLLDVNAAPDDVRRALDAAASATTARHKEGPGPGARAGARAGPRPVGGARAEAAAEPPGALRRGAQAPPISLRPRPHRRLGASARRARGRPARRAARQLVYAVPAGSRAPHRAADQGGLGRRRGVVQGGPAAAPAAAPARVDTRRAARTARAAARPVAARARRRARVARALQASRQGRDGLGRVQREPPGRRARAGDAGALSVFGVLLSAFLICIVALVRRTD